MTQKVVFGTGTRQLATKSKTEKLHAFLLAKTWLHKLGASTVISGMAEGWDETVAKAALQLELPLHLYIPNKGYGNYYWGKNSVTGVNRINEFNELIESANNIMYTSDIYGTDSLYVNGVHMNFLRNYQMVDDSDVGIGWDKTSKGTSHCVSYAKKNGVEVIMLDEMK